MTGKFFFITGLIFITLFLNLYTQNKPVIIEAESGSPGPVFSVTDQAGVVYITPATDYKGTDTLPGDSENPASLYQTVETYMNPVLPGDHPDPTLLKKGNDFYHCGSSFHFTPYLPILHSTDLVHWKEISRVIPSNWSGLLNDAPSYGIWQGAITYFYDSYWIYFSNTAGGGQYFSKALSPEGPWSAPVKMNTTSTTGASGYDNSVFVDDDSTAYLLIKPGQYTNRIQKIGTNGHLTDTVINLDWVNADGKYSWAEGPVMCKRDGWYYYFIAGNVAGGQYVLRSQSLTGDQTKWEALGNVFAPVTDPLAGLRSPNHMSQPFQLDDGTWWTIAHSYENAGGNDWSGQGRQGILHQIAWDTNGKPTGTAPTSLSLAKPDLPQSGIPWKLPRSDYFESTSLDLSWHFLNRAAVTRYSLTERPGWLSINPVSGRSHILHKDGGHCYALVTRVDIDANEAGQAAGIYLTNGNESVNVRLFCGYSGSRKIIFTFNNITYEAENTIGNVVWLKLERKEHNLSGYYSSNGVSWTRVGNIINAANLDKSQPNYNSWVGNSHGLYAERKQAYFDLFIYKDGFSALPATGFNNAYGIKTITKVPGKVVTNSTAEGGWLMLGGVELGTGEKVPVKVDVTASCVSGGDLEIWLDDIENEGTKIATIQIAGTGGADTWQTFSGDVSGINGQHDIYLRFSGTENAFYIHTIQFVPDPSSYPSDIHNYSLMDNEACRVYPNPYSHGFTIDIGDAEGKYTIYDLSGKTVETRSFKNVIHHTGVELPPSFYILKVETKEKWFELKLNKIL